MWKMCSTPSLFYYHLNLSSFQCRQFHTMVINGGRKGRGVLWWTHADGIWSTLCAGNDNPLQHVTAWILGANDGWTWQLCSFWMRQFPNNWIGMIQTMWFKAHVVIGQENGLPLKKKKQEKWKRERIPPRAGNHGSQQRMKSPLPDLCLIKLSHPIRNHIYHRKHMALVSVPQGWWGQRGTETTPLSDGWWERVLPDGSEG